MEINKVHNSDCILGLSNMESDSVDCIITDPPYNIVGKQYSNPVGGSKELWVEEKGIRTVGSLIQSGDNKIFGGGDWKRIADSWDIIDNYDEWSMRWLAECKRILKPTGSIMVFCSLHNMFDIGQNLEKLGMKRLNLITWFKTNAPPNITCRTLTHSCEYILWYGKDKNWTFNYKDMKELECNEDFIKKSGKQMRDVWAIPNNKTKEETKYGKHTAQKPLRLMDRLVKMATRVDDIVVDPFSGSGSTLVSCKKLGRNYIGFEIDDEFIEMTRNRLGDNDGSCSKTV